MRRRAAFFSAIAARPASVFAQMLSPCVLPEVKTSEQEDDADNTVGNAERIAHTARQAGRVVRTHNNKTKRGSGA